MGKPVLLELSKLLWGRKVKIAGMGKGKIAMGKARQQVWEKAR